MRKQNDRNPNTEFPGAQIFNLPYRDLANCALPGHRCRQEAEDTADSTSGKQIANLRHKARVFTWYLAFGIWSFTGLASSAQETNTWRPLFNGRDLSGWKANDFAGAAEVKVEDGKIVI